MQLQLHNVRTPCNPDKNVLIIKNRCKLNTTLSQRLEEEKSRKEEEDEWKRFEMERLNSESSVEAQVVYL